MNKLKLNFCKKTTTQKKASNLYVKIKYIEYIEKRVDHGT